MVDLVCPKCGGSKPYMVTIIGGNDRVKITCLYCGKSWTATLDPSPEEPDEPMIPKKAREKVTGPLDGILDSKT